MNEKVILLVEDNPDDAELTRRAFRKAEVPVRIAVAEDGLEALDYLFRAGKWDGRSTEGDPHLVLLDLKLPKIDGLGVLQRLRDDARTRLLPVVILTSSVEQQDLIRGYNLGCNSYIHKPVDFVRFIGTAKTIGDYWLELNVPPLHADVE
ncbi:MAG TPA: response regulator [Verrucomicrobiae bacterium]|nr:response regulator [Verrucomicrobiae bacterium]